MGFHVSLCRVTPSHLTVTARITTDSEVAWRRFRVRRRERETLPITWSRAVGMARGWLPHEQREALGPRPQQLPLEI